MASVVASFSLRRAIAAAAAAAAAPGSCGNLRAARASGRYLAAGCRRHALHLFQVASVLAALHYCGTGSGGGGSDFANFPQFPGCSSSPASASSKGFIAATSCSRGRSRSLRRLSGGLTGHCARHKSFARIDHSLCRRATGAAPLEAPLRSLPLPGRFIGSGYYIIDLAVRSNGAALRMVLDTGLTAPVMLTSKACERLGLAAGSASSRGIGATGSLMMQTVDLDGVEIKTPGDSSAVPISHMSGVVVDDFIQQKMGEEVGVEVDGMLGQGFLDLLDLELDPFGATLRAWPPGTMPTPAAPAATSVTSMASVVDGWGAAPIAAECWTELRTLRLPGELYGVLLSVPGTEEAVLGIVDSGASHTVINTKAAALLGLQSEAKKNELLGRTVRGIGLGNTALHMPLVTVSGIRLCGAQHVEIVRWPGGPPPRNRVGWEFGATHCVPGSSSSPFFQVELGVGDIGFFEELLSQTQDTIGQFEGAAALIGQDLLTQRALRLSAKGTLWMGPAPARTGHAGPEEEAQ